MGDYTSDSVAVSRVLGESLADSSDSLSNFLIRNESNESNESGESMSRCTEAFISARRTTTWERNWLSPNLIRSLQLLKHKNHNLGRLEGRSLWVYTEEDMNAISVGMGENGADEYLDDE